MRAFRETQVLGMISELLSMLWLQLAKSIFLSMLQDPLHFLGAVEEEFLRASGNDASLFQAILTPGEILLP